jgi:hypothetical protein
MYLCGVCNKLMISAATQWPSRSFCLIDIWYEEPFGIQSSVCVACVWSCSASRHLKYTMHNGRDFSSSSKQCSALWKGWLYIEFFWNARHRFRDVFCAHKQRKLLKHASVDVSCMIMIHYILEIRTIEGGGIALHSLDLGVRRGGWSAPRPVNFTPGEGPVPIVQEAGWASGPVWTCAKNLAPVGIRHLDRPARSQSLYRLSYPAPYLTGTYVNTVDFQRYTAFSQNQNTSFAWRVTPVLPHNALCVSLRIIFNALKFKPCHVFTHLRLLLLIVYVTMHRIVKSGKTRSNWCLIIMYCKRLSLWYYL